MPAVCLGGTMVGDGGDLFADEALKLGEIGLSGTGDR
jgi:hypothetical protein